MPGNAVESCRINGGLLWVSILLNFRKFSFRQTSFSHAFARSGWSGVKTSFRGRLAGLRAANLSWHDLWARSPKWDLRGERISAWVCGALLWLIAGCATWWSMCMAQVPFPSAVSNKGVVFYEAASGQTVRVLFGEKTFDASRLVLRGVVITGNEGGANQGMALIEVDGKPAEAIAIGEMVPPGIRLEKIQPDGVTVTYQGRELNLQQ